MFLHSTTFPSPPQPPSLTLISWPTLFPRPSTLYISTHRRQPSPSLISAFSPEPSRTKLTQTHAITSKKLHVNTTLFFNPSSCPGHSLAPAIPPGLKIYTYPVTRKKNVARRLACEFQYTKPVSSGREAAARSVMPCRVKRAARKEREGEGAERASAGWGLRRGN